MSVRLPSLTASMPSATPESEANPVTTDPKTPIAFPFRCWMPLPSRLRSRLRLQLPSGLPSERPSGLPSERPSGLRSRLPCSALLVASAIAIALAASSRTLAAPAGEEGARAAAEILEVALRSPHERSGDFDAFARSLIAMIAKHPQDFRSELLARRLAALGPSLLDEPSLLAELEALLAAPPSPTGTSAPTGTLAPTETSAPTGTVRQVLTDILSRRLRAAGREEDHRRIERDRGFLQEWLVIGPFGKDKGSLFARAFPPQRELRLDARYDDGWQSLTWRRVARKKPGPLFNPLAYIYPQRGVAYALAQVRSDEERTAILHRSSTENLQIWLNGTLVADDDFGASLLSNRRRACVRLAAGMNRILVKTRTAFWLRLSDPKDEPFPPGALVETTDLAIHPVESPPPALGEGPCTPGILETWARWVDEIEAASAAAPEADSPEADSPEASSPQEAATETRLPEEASPEAPAGETDPTAVLDPAEESDPAGEPDLQSLLADAHLGLALLQQIHGRDDLAVRAARRAVGLRPLDPATVFLAGGIFRGAGYLPRNISKNLSKQAYESAIAQDPDFVPVYERLARSLAEDEQYVPAIARAKEGLERNPRHLPLLLRLKDIYAVQGWQPEEIEIVREIEKVSPTSTVPAAFWTGYHRNLDHAQEAEASIRRSIDLERGRPEMFRDLAYLQRQRGDLEGAEASLRTALALEPDSRDLQGALVDVLADAGRLDEAIAGAKDLAAESPEDPEGHRRLADLLDRAGKESEAIEAYRRAIRLEPGDIPTRRYLLSREAGSAVSSEARALRDDAFWLPYDESLESWLPRVPAEGPLVEKAAAVLVLDISVLRLYPDGSSSEYVHQAHKILTEEAKEELARASTRGEIVALRTLTPSGESLEPVAAEGRSSFVMPGLAPGATIEIAYRTDNARARGMPLRTSSFYFQDVQMKSPFILSRWVILVPPGMDPSFVETALDGDARAAGAAESVVLARVTKTVRELEGGGRAIIYEAREAPRLESEPYMPDADEYFPNARILERRSWEDVAGLLRDRHDGSTRVTPEIEAEAERILAGVEDPLERVKAIYKAVNDTVTSESGGGQAVQVLLEKAGNRNVLFKALLDAAGIPARWAYLRPREGFLAKTEWSYPGPEMFPYPYVRVELAGKEPLHVTLSDRNTPFARLAEFLQGGKVLLLERGSQTIADLPPFVADESATSFEGTLLVTAAGEVDVDMAIISRSQSAYAQKDRLRTLPAFQKDLALRAMANQFFPGARLASGELRGLEAPEEPFAIAFKATAPKALRTTPEGRLLRAIVQPARLVRTFLSSARREHPLHFRNQIVIRDRMEVRAGDGFAVSAVPSGTLLVCPLGTYSLTYKRSEAGGGQGGGQGDGGDGKAVGETVEVRRELTMLPGRLTAAEFERLVEFARKLDAAEEESIVLVPR